MRPLRYFFLVLIFSYSALAPAQALQQLRYYQIEFILLPPDCEPYSPQQARLAGRAFKAAKAASLLYNERKQPALTPSSLLLKAKGDYANMLTALQNYGFYGGSISILINGREAHNIAANSRLALQNHITVIIKPQLPFRLRYINISSITRNDTRPYDETLFLPHQLKFLPGQLAKAPLIKEAQTKILKHLAQLGYSRPKILHNRITAQHHGDYIDVDMLIDRQQKLYFSRLNIINNTPDPHLTPDRIAYFSGFIPTSLYTPQNMEAMRHNLESLDLFSTVILQPGKSDIKGAVPLHIIVTEKPRRNITAGLEFATQEGLGLNLTWLHRNLFGQGERLTVKAGGNAIGLNNINHRAESALVKHFGYDFTLGFDKPGIAYYNAHGAASLRAWREYTDYYNTKQIEAKAGLYKPLSEQWLGSAYLSLSNIYDVSTEFGRRHFNMLGLDANLSLDKRDNNLSPSRGIFLNMRANPFYTSGGARLAERLELEGRSYIPLDRDYNYILALRAKWGMIKGASLQQLPLSMQYFAGGAGSIRGYAYKSIGVICPNHGKDRQCEIGGRSLLLGNAELRAKIWRKWGLAAFIDSGYIGASSLDFSLHPNTGIGLGLRYNSPLGPLRVDVARPLRNRPGQSHMQIYLGIGEVF